MSGQQCYIVGGENADAKVTPALHLSVDFGGGLADWLPGKASQGGISAGPYEDADEVVVVT